MARPRKTTSLPPIASVRGGYVDLGVRAYYEAHAADYANPHEPAVVACLDTLLARHGPDLSHVLDLACGSGEVTDVLRRAGALRCDGIDPYTGPAYLARTGQAAEAISFEEIANGALAGRSYSLIVCSYALHLLERSWLAGTLTQLALVAPELWVLTPNKRPVLREAWGWRLVEEIVVERVRARLYVRG